jgi:hypothetical protein
MRKLLTLAGLVGAYVYFFDKDSGARRRAEARDRVLALLNPVRRELGRTAAGVQSQASGLAQKRKDLKAPITDDASPAAKVES